MKKATYNISKNLRLLHNKRVLDDIQTDHSELDHCDEQGFVHAYSSCPMIRKDNRAIEQIYGQHVDQHFVEAEKKGSAQPQKASLKLIR